MTLERKIEPLEFVVSHTEDHIGMFCLGSFRLCLSTPMETPTPVLVSVGSPPPRTSLSCATRPYTTEEREGGRKGGSEEST